MLNWLLGIAAHWLQSLDWMHIMNDIVIGGLLVKFRQWFAPSVATPPPLPPDPPV